MVKPSLKLNKEKFSSSGIGAGSTVGGALGNRYGIFGRAVGSLLGGAAGKQAEVKANYTDLSKIKTSSGVGAGSAVGGGLGNRYGIVGRAVGSSLGGAAGKQAEEKANYTDLSKIKPSLGSNETKNEPPDSPDSTDPPDPPDSPESSDDDSDDESSSFLGRFKPSFGNPLNYMKLNFLKKYFEKILGKNYKTKLMIITIVIVLFIIIYISMEIKKMRDFLDEDYYDY